MNSLSVPFKQSRGSPAPPFSLKLPAKYNPAYAFKFSQRTDPNLFDRAHDDWKRPVDEFRIARPIHEQTARHEYRESGVHPRALHQIRAHDPNARRDPALHRGLCPKGYFRGVSDSSHEDTLRRAAL